MEMELGCDLLGLPGSVPQDLSVMQCNGGWHVAETLPLASPSLLEAN